MSSGITLISLKDLRYCRSNGDIERAEAKLLSQNIDRQFTAPLPLQCATISLQFAISLIWAFLGSGIIRHAFVRVHGQLFSVQ